MSAIFPDPSKLAPRYSRPISWVSWVLVLGGSAVASFGDPAYVTAGAYTWIAGVCLQLLSGFFFLKERGYFG